MSILQGCWRAKTEADCTSLQWSESDRNQDNKFIGTSHESLPLSFFLGDVFACFFHIFVQRTPPILSKSPSWPSKRGQFNHSIMEWEKPDFQLLSFTHSWGQIDDPNLTFAYFSNGLVQLQPPTRRCEFTAAQQNQNPQTMQRHWRPIALGLASQQCPASPRLQQLGHHPPELGESVKKRRGQKIRLKIVWYNIISVRAFMWAI